MELASSSPLCSSRTKTLHFHTHDNTDFQFHNFNAGRHVCVFYLNDITNKNRRTDARCYCSQSQALQVFEQRQADAPANQISKFWNVGGALTEMTRAIANQSHGIQAICQSAFSIARIASPTVLSWIPLPSIKTADLENTISKCAQF